MLSTLVHDVAFALQHLRKRPGFTLVAVLVLALGLGANAAIFSVVNAILLQPLPYAQPDRLTGLFEREVIGDEQTNPVAPGNFLDWQRDARAFVQIAATGESAFNLASTSGSALPERINGAICSANLFVTLGVQPVLGRVFREEEDRPGGPRVAIISYGLWQRRFRRSNDVIHQTIRLDSQNYSIVGVMPERFAYPYRTVQAWVPLQQVLSPRTLKSHGNHFLTVIGRLRPGVTVERGRAEIDGIASRYKREHPEEIAGKGGNVLPLRENSVQSVRTSLLVLFGAVGCVLLIACVNVANLLLTRAIGRQREVAIRAAVGATRTRLIRQLLTESVVLSLLGAGVGLILASYTTEILAARAPNANYLPQVDRISVDYWVFCFTFGVALLTGVAAGLFPALQFSRSDLVNSLKESGRSATPGRSHGRFRDILVAAEVALSLILLVASGLLLRSFGQLLSVHTGVRTANMLTMAVSLPSAGYKEHAQVSAFYQRLTERLQTVPGVQSLGLVTCAPVAGHCGDEVFQIEGHPLPPGQLMDALQRAADPGYFAAAGIPILKGRVFDRRDGVGFDTQNPKMGAIIVSESMVKAFFKDSDPIGQHIYFDTSPAPAKNVPRYEVIGVVGDVLKRLDAKVQPTMYRPLLDGASSRAYIVMHTSTEPHSVAGAVRAEINQLDRDLPVFEIRTMDEIVGRSAQDRQFSMLLLGLFAGLALVLAAIGLYGVLSYSVTQRKGEMGIRLALGASAAEVRRLVLVQGMRPAVGGIVVGLLGAIFASRLLRTLLFGISPGDPITFAAVPLVLLAVAALACSIPAIRATRIDPTVALRNE